MLHHHFAPALGSSWVSSSTNDAQLLVRFDDMRSFALWESTLSTDSSIGLECCHFWSRYAKLSGSINLRRFALPAQEARISNVRSSPQRLLPSRLRRPCYIAGQCCCAAALPAPVGRELYIRRLARRRLRPRPLRLPQLLLRARLLRYDVHSFASSATRSNLCSWASVVGALGAYTPSLPAPSTTDTMTSSSLLINKFSPRTSSHSMTSLQLVSIMSAAMAPISV